jgi:hypothetical protein
MLYLSFIIVHHSYEDRCTVTTVLPYPKLPSQVSVPSTLFWQSAVSHIPSDSIRPSLFRSSLRVPSGSNSRIPRDNLLPGILFTCPNHHTVFLHFWCILIYIHSWNYTYVRKLFFARQPPVDLGLIHEVSRSRTTTHHNRKDSCGRAMSPSQRPLPDNAQ